MKGHFLSNSGNDYDNFQMLGYIDADSPEEAVSDFLSQPQFPIIWADVDYMWAEELANNDSNGHYVAYQTVYMGRESSDKS